VGAQSLWEAPNDWWLRTCLQLAVKFTGSDFNYSHFTASYNGIGGKKN